MTTALLEKEQIQLMKLLENYLRDIERYREGQAQLYALMSELANQTIGEILSSIDNGTNSESVAMYSVAIMFGVVKTVELFGTYPLFDTTYKLGEDILSIMHSNPIGGWITELVLHGDKDVGNFPPTDEELIQ